MMLEIKLWPVKVLIYSHDYFKLGRINGMNCYIDLCNFATYSSSDDIV